MKINLSDNGHHQKFAPLSLTRPVGQLRMGLFTNEERYRMFLPEVEIGFETEAYLSSKYKSVHTDITANSNIIPNEDLVAAICNLENNQSLVFDGVELARKGSGEDKIAFTGEEPVIITERWHLYQLNDRVLSHDFSCYTSNRKSQELSESNTLIGDPSQLFIEEGAIVEGSILNTSTGPIYIGQNAEIMEGCLIRGGLAVCDHAQLKMGSKIYGATTIGPYCKVGGEVSNVIFQSYSNKGHDGFLGNSVIGEWCNLGADTNTSNLKNNYSSVRTYSYELDIEIQTDIQFMGLFMGDFSKSGINTMFNTATVVGVSCTIFGSGFPGKHISCFSWVNGTETSDFILDKAFEASDNMMQRRNLKLSAEEQDILRHLSESKP